MQIGNSFLSQEINRNLPAKGTLDPCQLSLTYFTSYPIVVTYLHLLSALESLARWIYPPRNHSDCPMFLS